MVIVREPRSGEGPWQGESAGTAYELLYRRCSCRQQYTWPGAAANHVQVSCLHGWTRDSHIGPGWRETLTAKEGNGWREDPRQWATGQAAQLTGVETCNAGARCQTWRRMLLGAINLYCKFDTGD